MKQITIPYLRTKNFLKDKDRESYYLDIENGMNRFDLMYYQDTIYLKSRYDQENLDVQALPHIKTEQQLENLILALRGYLKLNYGIL